jgi:hypothetical protein
VHDAAWVHFPIAAVECILTRRSDREAAHTHSQFAYARAKKRAQNQWPHSRKESSARSPGLEIYKEVGEGNLFHLID